jgi:hypothetical protein
MEIREGIIWFLTNTGWILLGCVLNVFYPNSMAINNLLPNFLLVFSMIIIFQEEFVKLLPIVILGGIIDSLWRGINPGTNVLSLVLSCVIVFLLLHRLWKSKWLIISAIFPTTLLYFIMSYFIIFITQTGTLRFNDAVSFGIVQGIYNTFWALIFLISFPKIFIK